MFTQNNITSENQQIVAKQFCWKKGSLEFRHISTDFK
jgi:hypothetical protein